MSNPIIYNEDGELLNQQYSIDTRRLLRLRFGYEGDLIPALAGCSLPVVECPLSDKKNKSVDIKAIRCAS